MITITEIEQILDRYGVPELVTDGFNRRFRRRGLLEALSNQSFDHGYAGGVADAETGDVSMR